MAAPILVPRSEGGVVIVAMLAALMQVGGRILARARIPWNVVESRANGIALLQEGGSAPSRNDLATGLGERAPTSRSPTRRR